MNTRRGELPCLMHFVYSLGIGGAEKLAYDMIMGLPAGKYRPVVLCVGEDGPLRSAFEERGYTVHFRPNTPGETWRTVSWIKGLIRKEQVAVIHAHQYNPLQYSVLATLGTRGVNLVYTEHGRMYPEVWNWKRYLTNPLFALRINHIVSISESTAAAMQRYDNLPGKRIQVVHNGVNLEELNPGMDRQQMRRSLGLGEGARVIGTAGRLEQVKNLPMMLRVFKAVLAVFPDTVLLIAGKGSERANLEALASELGIDGQVRFLGLRHDLPAIFELLEVFLLASFTEGISITLLEAMGTGLPAVVTRAGGNPEVVLDGVTGYLVEVGDDTEMSQKVIELLADPQMAARFGSRGRDRVRDKFSFRSMMESYLRMYEA